MRIWIAAGVMGLATAANAQDGAHVATLAQVREHKAAWVGEFVRVERVTISSFAQFRGGLASDATGSLRFDDLGLSLEVIRRLERSCGDAHAEPNRAECRGALEFTMRGADGARGGYVINEATFIPGD